MSFEEYYSANISFNYVDLISKDSIEKKINSILNKKILVVQNVVFNLDIIKI